MPFAKILAPCCNFFPMQAVNVFGTTQTRILKPVRFFASMSNNAFTNRQGKQISGAQVLRRPCSTDTPAEEGARAM
jgi:hypothetical protein